MGMLGRSTPWLGVLFIQACASPAQLPGPNAVDAEMRRDSTQ
jgi:hypothetical protein